MAKQPTNEIEAKRFKGKFDKTKPPFLTEQEQVRWDKIMSKKLTKKNK